MSDDFAYMTALDLRRLIRTRQVSPVAIVESALRRLEALQPVLNPFVTVTAELALEAARNAEAAVMAGQDQRLLGRHVLPGMHPGIDEHLGLVLVDAWLVGDLGHEDLLAFVRGTEDRDPHEVGMLPLQLPELRAHLPGRVVRGRDTWVRECGSRGGDREGQRDGPERCDPR